MAPPFTNLLLRWYSHHARSLPWRGLKDPYAIWVSEIMLQQTRVETVIPYYQRWLKRFPNLESLADSSEQDVLQAWEGLGYYGRARNLFKTAKIVMEEHSGRFPSKPDGLRKLPGIGGYTSAAIASIAFGLDIPALDANGERILARCFVIELPVKSPEGRKALAQLAQDLLPSGKAGIFNQALMDLGSLICKPISPQCGMCPMKTTCQAYGSGRQETLPVKASPKLIPHYIVTAAVIKRNGRYLIARRPSSGLLGGLWEFPGGKQDPGESLAGCLQREIQEELGTSIQVGSELGIFLHAYTHFRITLHAFNCQLVGQEPQPLQVSELRWVNADELQQFPMGKVDRLISTQLSTGRNK